MKKEKIGIFGGTFNPIHLGHLKAAEVVQEKFSLDRILFVPSYLPPHKDSSEVAQAEDRLKMVDLSVIGHPRFVSSSIEVDIRRKSYSIITLKKIKDIYPEALLFFILGVDAFLEIETWRDYEQVLEQCYFVVIDRPGFRLDNARNVLNGALRGKIYDCREGESAPDGLIVRFRIFLFSVGALDISSTEIRERIKNDKSIKGLVPPAVESYIQEKKLYQRENG